MSRHSNKSQYCLFVVIVTLIASCTPAPTTPAEGTSPPPTGGYPLLPDGGLPTSIFPQATGYPLQTEPAPPRFPVGENAPTVTVIGPAQALAAAAVDDLSRREGVNASQIAVLDVSPQIWPDASLGCPEPDQTYAQVITDGYRIVLAAGGQQYAYHTDRARVVLCAQDRP